MENVSKKDPKMIPGRFKKGHPGGPGRGKKRLAPNAGINLAADMKLAYTTPESPDDSPGVKAARRLAHDDYPKFMTIYARLCGTDIAPAEEEQVAAAATIGQKEEKVEELITKLLQEWESEEAQASLAS